MSIVVSILFILFGVAIKYGKMYYLIAGYNTMSKEEQKKYDIDGIATVFRNAMFGMSIVILMGYVVSKYLENPKIEFYTVIVSVVVGVAYLLLVSNSNKYKLKK